MSADNSAVRRETDDSFAKQADKPNHIPSKVIYPKRSPKKIFLWVLKRSLRAFSLVVGIKGGIGFLLRLLKFMRGKKEYIIDVFRESFFGPDTIRLASCFSGYVFIFKFCNEMLNTYGKWTKRVNAFIAGLLSGSALLIESPINRLAYCQQFSMRAVQGIYNALKFRQYFSFPLGDSVAFVLSCAQIMYAYTMQPHTLPKDFYKFMLATAKLPETVLKANARVVRDIPLDLPALLQFAVKRKATPENLAIIQSMSPTPNMLPSAVIHPNYNSSVRYCVWLAKKVLLQIFPIYMTLHTVPVVVLKSATFLKSPVSLLTRSFLNTFRSSSFLVVFVTGYQALCSFHRVLHDYHIVKKDHKLYYYLFGFLTSLSIFIEEKKRRSELTLYVAPKAIHSFYQISVQRDWLPKVKHLDVAVGSVALGIIMSFYECEPERLSPMIQRVMSKFL
ncbi:hypothetical protein BKA69DRAFT_1068209 [Paraphysoderma sedebokerense]|nr:hypothetical protein BKA69DRAFT_1068209 [Paraphysoderma sedebokerense]